MTLKSEVAGPSSGKPARQPSPRLRRSSEFNVASASASTSLLAMAGNRKWRKSSSPTRQGWAISLLNMKLWAWVEWPANQAAKGL